MKTLKKTMLSTLAITLCASLLLSSEITLVAYAVDKPITEPNVIEEVQEYYSDEGIEKHEKHILGEIEDKRDQFDKHFKLKDGSMLAVQYDIPVHFKEDDENWTEYDNRLDLLSENGKEFYKNRKSDIDIRLSSISSDENMVSLDIGDAEVDWGYADVDEAVGVPVNKEDILEGNDRFTVLQTIVSQINYENIYNDVDAEYYVSSVGIKENLVLKSEEAQRSFTVNYNIGELSAKQTDKHTIILMNKGDEVYTISAPFMTDADGDTSDDLSLYIISQNEGQLTVLLQADDIFFDEDCHYPVVIDPDIKTKKQNQLESTFANSNYPNSIYGGENSTNYIYTGFHNSGRCYSYVQIAQLPSMNSGDIIVHSTIDLSLSQITGDFITYPDLYVNAYEVINSWDQSALTWNNKPSMSPTVIDYNKFTSSSGSDIYSWDITGIAKKWYNGSNNYGIGFKNYDDPDSQHDVKFYSLCASPNENLRPFFTLQYMNNEGIEDYWTYTSFDVGTAGTAYINDYTGNLVFVHNDASIAGNNGFTLQHIFNNSAVDGAATDLPYSGKGWRLNVQQKVKNTSSLLGIDTNKYPFIYTDGDGTEHYFVRYTDEDGIYYYDEDGLGLELVINLNSSAARYEISDIGDNKMTFDANGDLRKIEDSNGNFVTVNRTNSGEITSVSAQNGNSTSLKTINISNSDSYYIQEITDAANRTTYYYYTNNRLILIVNPDATSIRFSYDSDGSISSVEDIDEYKVEFIYNTILNGKRVTSIQEKGTDDSSGQKISFDYSQNNTTSIQTSGVDNIYGTNDDVISTYQFDYYGRTISVKTSSDGEGVGAAGCTYTGGEADLSSQSNDKHNIKNLNRISTQHYSNLGTKNYIKNANMEYTTNWSPMAYNGSNTFTACRSDDYYYFGKYSYKINCTAYDIGSRARILQYINASELQVGKNYTLSAYVKISDINSTQTNYGAQIATTVFRSDNTFTAYYSELMTEVTDDKVDDGWRRLNVTFMVPSDTTNIRVDLYLRSATGTIYFDGVQLEEGDTFNKFNMIENAGFENVSNNFPVNWTGDSLTSNDICDTQFVQEGSKSYKFVGDPSVEKTLYQEINISGKESDTYILSGWMKSDRIKSGIENSMGFDSSEMLTAQVCYSDGTSIIKHIDMFNDCISDWQFCSGSFDLSDNNSNTDKTPVKIIISLRCANQANDCYFDNIQLIKDSIQSYVYDDGNLVGYSENAQDQATMQYSGADMIKSTDAEGNETNYDYDNNHNLTEVESETGITSEYDYDSNGNLITTEIHDNDTTDENEIKTDVSYTSDGLYVSQTEDEDGNTTSYTYDSNTGNLTSVTDSKGTTNYTYDGNTDLPLTASKNNITVTYGYTNGTKRNLTSVSNGYVTYNLNYDKFNNLQQASIGSNTLATYTYGSSNGSLSRLTYGNGDYIDYLYNAYGSTNEIKQNGTTAFKWYTDNSGNAVRHIDNIAGREYNYNYDTSGRLIGETIKSNIADSIMLPFARVSYAYDLNNNVSSIINVTGNKTVVTDYEYGLDNLPDTVKINNDKTESFTYDSLNRLTSTNIDLDNDITTSYTYKASDRNTGNSTVYQTTKIETETIGGKTYKYSYDSAGNITNIYQRENNIDTELYRYVYDSFSQLVTDIDFTALIRTDYTYDSHGNITNVLKSNINQNGVITSTISSVAYQYNDSTWADKLTSYGGSAITYDAIGNPLSYRNNMTMTWQNGRELATLTKGSNSVSYTYGADGIRTTKTVNGNVTKYEYVGGQLLYENTGYRKIYYVYDSNGNVLSAIYKASQHATEQTYYYAHNWRGDVVALYDSTGALFATYDYDSWGKLLSVKDANGDPITGATSFAIANPFRYRGYYYDRDSGLYYLQSRYYDPTTGRFVNADTLAYTTNDSFIGLNLFAYADNNFVNRIDYNGNITFPIHIPNLVLIATGLIITSFIIFNYDAISKTIGCIIVGGLTALGGAISNAADALSSAAQSIWKSIADSFSRAKGKTNYKSKVEIHHIVAKKAQRAKPAQTILYNLHININDSVNLIALKYGLHRRLHTKKYYDWVNHLIETAYKSGKGDIGLQKNNVIAALKLIKRALNIMNANAPF